MGRHNAELKIEEILNLFPIKLDDVVYNLYSNNVDVVYDENKKIYNYYIKVIDNLGYKHYVNYKILKNSIEKNKYLTRFFYGNPYTYDNINLFCKLNNIDLKINGINLPISGASRNKFDFYNSQGELKRVSWNQIQHYTETYKNNWNDVKLKRKKERELSKQDVIDIVKKMEICKGAPLDIYDFYPKQKDGIGIRTIRKFWSELWIMQKELGMKITGKHGSILSDEEVVKEIQTVCNAVKDIENRTVIMHNDFKVYGTYLDNRRYSDVCKKLKNCSLREYVESLGFELQSTGNGMNHTFDDGENTVSKYEYDFSIFLREHGFEYNKTYYRNIYYKNIDSEYTGNMNCDYCIDFNGNLVYIELAGILGNKGHQNAYRNNLEIKSKSKELYRQSLNKKREILERNNLNYYILLPDEMTIENYKNIVKNEMSKAT